MAHIYLSSPYTHQSETVRALRHDRAALTTAKLMERGWVVFSPIVHAYTVAEFMDSERQLDHDFWMRQARGMLRTAAYLVVLKIVGWDKSRGVREEILYAKENSIQIRYLGERDPLPSAMKLARAVA